MGGRAGPAAASASLPLLERAERCSESAATGGSPPGKDSERREWEGEVSRPGLAGAGGRAGSALVFSRAVAQPLSLPLGSGTLSAARAPGSSLLWTAGRGPGDFASLPLARPCS